MNFLKRILNIKSPGETVFQPKLFKVPKPSLNIKEYLKAIRTAHIERNKKLNVIKCGGRAYWDPKEDDGWVAYSGARYTIARHKKIDWFLDKINYI